MNRTFAEPLDDKIDWRVLIFLSSLLVGVVYAFDFIEQSKEDASKQAFTFAVVQLQGDSACVQSSLIHDLPKLNKSRTTGIVAEDKRLPGVVPLWNRVQGNKAWDETTELKLPECLEELIQRGGRPT